VKRRVLLVSIAVLAGLIALSAFVPGPPAAKKFVARLSGSSEVPARSTLARGTATFFWNEEADGFDYMLAVANISNVVASHIHCAAAGVNGPIGVTLFMGTAGSGPISGLIARGTLTAPDPGNACGWADMSAVASAMLSGNAYVNVHTNDGVAPTNTGPGDFPGGEIRGQIRLLGAP
jgi:hypothetical protein